MSDAAQFVILAFTCPAMWLVASGDPRCRLAGYVLNLLAQPAWIRSTMSNAQWGMFIVSLVLTGVWAGGIRNHIAELKRVPCSTDGFGG